MFASPVFNQLISVFFRHFRFTCIRSGMIFATAYEQVILLIVRMHAYIMIRRDFRITFKVSCIPPQCFWKQIFFYQCANYVRAIRILFIEHRNKIIYRAVGCNHHMLCFYCKTFYGSNTFMIYFRSMRAGKNFPSILFNSFA